MDVPAVIRQRLAELGVEQRDLATAAQVTESYISQLLTRKKMPPAPDRTDIYDKMEPFLELPQGELSKLADLQRKEALQRQLGDPLTPLFQDVRELMLRKCSPDNETHIRVIFEKQPFGELERLVTQKLLEVSQRVAKEELADANSKCKVVETEWLQMDGPWKSKRPELLSAVKAAVAKYRGFTGK